MVPITMKLETRHIPLLWFGNVQLLMECFQAFGFHGMVTPLTDRVFLIMVSMASKYRWRHF